MQFPFSVIVSMHTIFGIFVTPFHSNNVMLIRFSLYQHFFDNEFYNTCSNCYKCDAARHCVFSHNRILN